MNKNVYFFFFIFLFPWFCIEKFLSYLFDQWKNKDLSSDQNFKKFHDLCILVENYSEFSKKFSLEKNSNKKCIELILRFYFKLISEYTYIQLISVYNM